MTLTKLETQVNVTAIKNAVELYTDKINHPDTTDDELMWYQAQRWMLNNLIEKMMESIRHPKNEI